MHVCSDHTSLDSFHDQPNLNNLNDFDDVLQKHIASQQENDQIYEKELLN